MTRPLRDGSQLILSATRPLTTALPGNGGMRLWHYADEQAASTEALGLAAGMAVKHDTFYTGFSGAKLVCASSKSIADWSADDKQHLLDVVPPL